MLRLAARRPRRLGHALLAPFSTRPANSAPRAAAAAAAPAAHPDFDVVATRDLSEDLGDVTATLYRHRATQAEVLSMRSADTNKVFGVTFATPPDSSNGVAHILEHSVLCGGRKYPLKEPFVELLKGSMHTFLNAFTYPDRTCYPVASTNLKDFYNLVDVYLDAVFFPKITPLTFAQEGWHYALPGSGDAGAGAGAGAGAAADAGQEDAGQDADGTPLTFKGVVFNEMKGVYSQPDSLVHRFLNEALFPDPDHVYGHDSGGDPAAIPDLTYDEFVAFHRQHYRPSNAKVFFFGDDPEAERLRVVADTLDTLAEIEPSRCDALPQMDLPYRPLDSPGRRLTRPYAVADLQQQAGAAEATAAEEAEEAEAAEVRTGMAADDEDKHYVMLGWVLNDRPLSLEESITLGIANDLLVGNASSSLYRDLMDSRLGTAFIGGGLSDELQQATFSAGLKGVRPEDAAAVEAVVHASLRRVADEGFPEEAIAASVNSTEFSLLEFNTGGIPRGLALMLASNPAWLYRGDPFASLEYKHAMRAVRARLDRGEPLFSDAVRQFLCENTCLASVEMVPDSGLQTRLESTERAVLDAARRAMGPAEYAEVADTQQRLLEHQGTPDPAHVVEMIPRLELSDLDVGIDTTPRQVTAAAAATAAAGTVLLTHELPETNGIVYVDVALDISDVELSSLAWLPLFTSALTQTGTDTMDEAALTFQIGTDTGGLGASVLFTPVREQNDDDGTPPAWSESQLATKLVVRGKATTEKVGLLFGLLGDVLVGANLRNRDRLSEMLRRRREDAHSYLLSSGHAVASARLGSKLSKVGWLSEQMGGMAAYETMEPVDADSDAGWGVCEAQLERIRSRAVSGRGVVVNLTSDARGLGAAAEHVAAFVDRLPATPSRSSSSLGGGSGGGNTLGDFHWDARAVDGAGVNEGFAVPSQVNYVVQGARLPNVFEPARGTWSVVTRYLRNTWLWDEVRVTGGAYGGFCSVDLASRAFQYGSYRDPNLGSTLEAYGKSAAFLKGADLGGGEVTKAIVGTISDADSPRTPAGRGYTDMVHHIVGERDENRQRWRDDVLATTAEDFDRFAELLDEMHAGIGMSGGGSTVVVGDQAGLDEVAAGTGDAWDVQHVF